jgi:WD40 repeat protein
LRDEAIATLALTDLERTDVFLPHLPDAVVKAQGNPARSVFSDDLSRVAWCNLSGSISVVRVADRREERNFPAPSENSSALGSIWSPDGKFLAVSYRGENRVWEIETGRVVCSTAISFEPSEASFTDDSRLVALLSDRGVCLFSLPDGAQVRRIPLPEDVSDFRLHPQEPWLATSTVKDLQVFDFATNTAVKSYPMAAAILGVEWCRNGRLLGAMLRDGTFFIGDVRTRNKIRLQGPPERPIHLCFSRDGTWVASVSNDGTTRLWNALAGGPPAASTLDGLAQKFSPDGKRLAYTRAEGVGIWNVVQPDRLYTALVGRLGFDLVEHVCFSPDGRWMVSMSEGPDGLWVWDLNQRQLVASNLGAGPRRQWMSFTPDGKRLLTLGKDGLNAWTVHSSEEKLDIGPPEPVPLEADSIVSDVAALSTDGQRLLARVRPRRGLIVDLAKNGALTPFDTAFELRSVAWAPDGQRLALGTHRAAGTHVLTLDGFRDLRTLGDTDSHVAYSPDGKWLVSFTPSQCEFYHASTLRLAKAFPRMQIDRNPGAMAFSANGRYFAFLKRRSQVELIDPKNLASLATFELPDGNTADTVDFSPDGQWLAIHDKARCHLYHLPTLRTNLRDLGLDW